MKTTELITVLKEKIANGYAAPNGRLPNIGNIAKDFSVSPMTAQKAIKVLVEAEVLSSTRGKGVFLKRNPAATMRVGIVTMNYCNCTSGAEYTAAFGTFLTPAVSILKSAGAKIIRLDRDDLKGPETEIRAILDELDALLVTYGCIDRDTLTHLIEWKKPIVVIQHEEFCPYPFHQVIPDLSSGFSRLSSFFAEKNIRNILTATNSEEIHLARIKMFEEKIRENPITKSCRIKAIEIPPFPSDLGRIAGQRLGELILESGFRYDAVFTPSDFLAFGIIDTMNKQKKRYGTDYLLASYDNLEADSYQPFSEPILTCIGKSPEQISKTAANLLLCLNRLGPSNLFQCKVPCTLEIRKTMPA